MAEPELPTNTSDADYAAIEAAVMETARGRWFLIEFARRNRTADTQVLLEAFGRLEQTVTQERAARGMDRLRLDLLEMAKAISRTKSDVAALRPDQDRSSLAAPSEALDAIVRTTEQATSDILAAAEHVQETAWTLRENGADLQLCDELDRRATDIYTACSFQDLTAQRTGKIIQTLRYLETRIDGMIETWAGGAGDAEIEAAGTPDPAPEDAGQVSLTQGDVDSAIMDDDLFSPPADAAAPPVSSAPPPDHPEAPINDDNEPPLVDAVPVVESAEAVPRHGAAPIVVPEGLPGPMRQAAPIVFEAAEPTHEEPTHEEPTNVESDGTVIHLEAFAEIDALEVHEKLRRFT